MIIYYNDKELNIYFDSFYESSKWYLIITLVDDKNTYKQTIDTHIIKNYHLNNNFMSDIKNDYISYEYTLLDIYINRLYNLVYDDYKNKKTNNYISHYTINQDNSNYIITFDINYTSNTFILYNTKLERIILNSITLKNNNISNNYYFKYLEYKQKYDKLLQQYEQLLQK